MKINIFFKKILGAIVGFVDVVITYLFIKKLTKNNLFKIFYLFLYLYNKTLKDIHLNLLKSNNK